MSATDQNQPQDRIIDSDDAGQSRQYIEEYLATKQAELRALDAGASPVDGAFIKLDIATALVGIHRNDEAWEHARFAFDTFLDAGMWEQAVQCCDVLYQCSQGASLLALGMGVWLAVTFPIDPALTVNMLSYVVDETPGDADGAAVAAVTAHYIADIRASGKQHESLTFLTRQQLTRVAEQHAGVKDQESLDRWMQKLQLLEPDVFIPKLGLVIGAIVPHDQWWFDKDVIREKIPD